MLPPFSIELAHLYRNEYEASGIEPWVERLLVESAWLPPLTQGSAVCLFIDDYHGYPEGYTFDEKTEVATEMMRAARAVGVDVDTVAFESSCVHAADALAIVLPEGFDLINDEGVWGCAPLAAIFTLARLGVDPYHEVVLDRSITDTRRLAGQRTLTVLPAKYLGVEATVLDIIRQLRTPRIPLARIAYVFA